MSHQLQWAGMKVMVTGASGFIGTNLCRVLHQSGSDVHAISRVERVSEPGGVTWWKGNLANLTTARHLVCTIKPDIIFHLSGMVGARHDVDLVLPTFHSLLESTVNLLTATAGLSLRRVVLVGSMNEPEISHNELVPGSPYAAAKWASSLYGRMFRRLYGTPCVITRSFMAYGPAQDPTKLIPSVILSLLKGEAPQLASGQWQGDWIYIDDLVQGLLKAVEAPNIGERTLDFGTGTLISVCDLIGQLVRVMGTTVEPVFGALPDRPFEPMRIADIHEVHGQIGWKPTTSLTDGLRRTIEWYRMHPGSCRSVTS